MGWLVRLLFWFFCLFKRLKTGDFDVVGAGSVSIELGGYRNVVDVDFVEDDVYCLPPCGGGVGDKLEWELVRRGRRDYVLNVKWSVNRPRRFVWVVSWR